MTRPSGSQSCIYSPHLGPVGCLPAPNIFPLAKETFAKVKMFWNVRSCRLEFESGPGLGQADLKSGWDTVVTTSLPATLCYWLCGTDS